tara:strand:+ start:68 stop:508 length:441 start_codon:yes stop_codon:yes gene_type:complete
MHTLTQNKIIPPIPKGLAKPVIVAGINAIGRGQDRESLIQFFQTIAQTMGPEALAQYMNPDEAIKRLAAAQGIDYLNLIKSVDDRKQEGAQQKQDMQQAALLQQAGQFANSPMMDPVKNPQAVEGMNAAMQTMVPQQEEQPAPVPA